MITVTTTIQRRFHKTWIGRDVNDKHIETVRVTTVRFLLIPIFVFVNVISTNL